MRRMVFKARFLWLALVALIAGAWPVAAQAAVGLAGFAILSAAPGNGGAVTCVRSTVHGDVGSSGQPASVVKTGCSGTGSIIAPVSTQVVTEFNNDYSAFAQVTCAHTLTTLDFTQSLPPGVYCTSAAATATHKKLTLSGPANGTWLFKIGTSGTGALTGTDFSVVMVGGGQPCNVNWWVAQAASLTVDNGASTPFQGTILAGAAITLVGTVSAPTALTLTGRLLSKSAVSIKDSKIVGCTSPITVPGPKCDENASTASSHDGGKDCDSGDSDKDKDKDNDKDNKDQGDNNHDNQNQDKKSRD